MDLAALLADEDALSPVIGAVLMVAITVVLVSSVGIYVTAVHQEVPETAPDADLSFEYYNNSAATAPSADGDRLVVRHEGGDAIETGRLRVTVEGATDGTGTPVSVASGATPFGTGTLDTGGSGALTDGTFAGTTAGNGAAGADVDLSAATVRVSWAAGGRSGMLGTWRGPAA